MYLKKKEKVTNGIFSFFVVLITYIMVTTTNGVVPLRLYMVENNIITCENKVNI